MDVTIKGKPTPVDCGNNQAIIDRNQEILKTKLKKSHVTR